MEAERENTGMEERGNFAELQRQILAVSVAHEWDTAKLEWFLEEIRDDESFQRCLCGHYPIRELCYLRNRHNRNRALVGNVCVHRFLGLPSHLIFAGYRRLMEDVEAAASPAVINYAFEHGHISEWEYTFLTDTCRKRKLSFRQLRKRRDINHLILVRSPIKTKVTV